MLHAWAQLLLLLLLPALSACHIIIVPVKVRLLPSIHAAVRPPPPATCTAAGAQQAADAEA